MIIIDDNERYTRWGRITVSTDSVLCEAAEPEDTVEHREYYTRWHKSDSCATDEIYLWFDLVIKKYGLWKRLREKKHEYYVGHSCNGLVLVAS